MSTKKQQRPSDEEIQAYYELVREKEMKKPRVAPFEVDFEPLSKHLEGAQLDKLLQCAKIYRGTRPTRRDGNCFYRSYLCAYFERMVELVNTSARVSKEDAEPLLKEVNDFVARMEKSMERVEKVLGWDSFIFEDFAVEIIDLAKLIAAGKITRDGVIERMTDEESSDAIVTYARMLVGLYLTEHSSEYEPFLPEGYNMKKFVNSEVLPMDKDADHMQCLALAHELGVCARVEYVNNQKGKVHGHIIPQGKEPQVFLLYIPSHYEILYKDLDLTGSEKGDDKGGDDKNSDGKQEDEKKQ